VSAFNGNGGGPGFDVIVVGGGHNALTAAAYLQRAGLRTCVLEARELLGGACVTEELWPGQRVSRASYVVSMLQPKVVADLELTRFGYEPIPLDPPFATFAADGTPMLFHNDTAAMLERAAAFVRPLLLRPPPALGSRRPADLPALAAWAARTAGMPAARAGSSWKNTGMPPE